MRSIYGSILLSTLLFSGVAPTANLAFKSGSLDRFVSDLTPESVAQDNGNYCKPGESQRESCYSDRQSQLLLASDESKPGLETTRDQLSQETGRQDSIEFERGSSRLLSKYKGRGSGRVKLTNVDDNSDEVDSSDEAHRASGRLEA